MGAAADPVAAVAAEAVSAVPGVVSAYLFGSVAEGRAHRESDVDLGVLLAYADYPRAADRFDVRLLLTSRLSAALGRAADVVILNDAPPGLARRVMTTGRRILHADPDADRAMLLTVLSRAADLEPYLRRLRQVKLASLNR